LLIQEEEKLQQKIWKCIKFFPRSQLSTLEPGEE